jgi:hypothetical protein
MAPVRRAPARRWAIGSGFTGAVMGGVVLWFVLAFSTGSIDNPLGWLVVVAPFGCAAAAIRWPMGGGIGLTAAGLAFSGVGIIAVLVLIAVRPEPGHGSLPIYLFFVPLLAGLLLMLSGILFITSRGR